jgi:hypothetical protein
MVNNFPYISSDYFSEQFKPLDLVITNSIYNETEKRHYRDEVEFMMIAAGHGIIEINGTRIPISSGDLIQLMPYHVHRFVLDKTQISAIRIRCSLGLLLMTSIDRSSYLKAIDDLDIHLPITHLARSSKRNLQLLAKELFVKSKQLL